MKKLRQYFAAHLRDRYEPRRWDCSKFVLYWIASYAPAAAQLAAAKLVEAGYNEVEPGDAAGLRAVQAKFASTADGLIEYWAGELPDHVELPAAAKPGDIAVRADLACGIVDEDYQAVYLAEGRGYEKQPVGPDDRIMRVG